MLFNSFEFLFLFLPGVLAAYYLARRYLSHLAALFVLNLASLVFYAWWDVGNLPILLGSVAVNHVIARAMARWGNQPFLALGIVFNLALLGFFKYADFLIGNVNAVTPLALPELNVGLPLAISFFSFQQISFLVDIARRKTAPGHIFSHTLFVSFFPHIVAGPLVQHHQIAAQFADDKRKDDLSAIWASA